MFNKELYNFRYHEIDLENYSFLVTGGAGFIGSNIVEYLLKYNAGKVRVLDNLSNGCIENISEFIGLSNFEFIEGDIRDIKTCIKAVKGITYVTHQAALGSVPRSINDPLTTNQVNVDGFLNILNAAKDEPGIKRFVYAASSSTYGDDLSIPKKEGNEGKPLSPYAVTKLVNEIYAEVYSKVYSFNTIGLRYFNVFGPKQSPNNPYAAVIPIFIKSAKLRTAPLINGDGHTSRDFTFVENIVQANIKAMLNSSNLESNLVLNIANSENTSLNQLWVLIQKNYNLNILPCYKEERKGDIRHSLADISKAKNYIDYNPIVNFKNGLEITINNFHFE